MLTNVRSSKTESCASGHARIRPEVTSVNVQMVIGLVLMGGHVKVCSKTLICPLLGCCNDQIFQILTNVRETHAAIPMTFVSTQEAATNATTLNAPQIISKIQITGGTLAFYFFDI